MKRQIPFRKKNRAAANPLRRRASIARVFKDFTSPPGRAAFTLIELLVVIAIIAIHVEYLQATPDKPDFQNGARYTFLYTGPKQ